MEKIVSLLLCFWMCSFAAWAQPGESMYGDAVKADVKMKYVYSFEEALKKAKEEHKLIFFNCYADWAIPCHGMDKYVFSDQEFADWMDKHFVNFFMDVTTPAGRPLAEKYNIHFQAHYLILDSEGNIVHRIVGGCQLPEFKEKVALALNPKTSLAGLNKRYEKGERGAGFLKDYALVLRTAEETEKYGQVTEEYFAKIKQSNWAKEENWILFNDKVRERKGEMFDYLMSHTDEFIKNNGEQAIYNKIASLYFRSLYNMATGENYNGAELLEIYMMMQRLNFPKDHLLYTVYYISKYRGEKDFNKMMEVFETKVPSLDERTAPGLDFSLKNWKEMSVSEQKRVVDYWTKRAEQSEGKLRNAYLSAIKEMLNPEGIQFADLSFKEALEKAQKENKLVFMDCYTSWCGPCKMMSKEVFTQKNIGDFFNQRFINLKIDMEKGEGKSLQERYEVKAFPTMLLLDGEGKVVYKILGGHSSREFMQKIERGILPEACYYQLKEKYENGDRSGELMPDYFLTMIDAGELKNQSEIVRNYLNLLKDEEKYTKSTWKLYDYLITDFKMPEFRSLCENRKHFVEQGKEAEVNHKIESIIFPEVIGYLNQETSPEDMKTLRELIAVADFSNQFSLSYLNRIVDLYDTKEYGKVLDLYENEISGISDAFTKLNLDVLLKSLMKSASSIDQGRAVVYVKKCLENADPKAVNAYKRLLEVLSGKEA